ncbi:MAG TPA: hypothetical protein VD790_09795 [Thermoleophilaceae bacterium]|nr:hypothetical protein [Thermoleophilaceae bacterium]
MRATRAYITSLGTTGLLLAFSASLLLVVGTLFAFDAWPGASIRDAVDSVMVDEDEPAFAVAGPEQVALDAAPAAAAVATIGGPGDDPDGLTTDDGTPVPTGGNGDASFTPGAPTGGDTGGSDDLNGPTATNNGSGGTPAAPSTPTAPDPVGQALDSRRSTNHLADATEQITNNLGNGLSNVTPNLGEAVSETGENLSEIVRGLPDVKVGGVELKLGR